MGSLTSGSAGSSTDDIKSNIADAVGKAVASVVKLLLNSAS